MQDDDGGRVPGDGGGGVRPPSLQLLPSPRTEVSGKKTFGASLSRRRRQGRAARGQGWPRRRQAPGRRGRAPDPLAALLKPVTKIVGDLQRGVGDLLKPVAKLVSDVTRGLQKLGGPPVGPRPHLIITRTVLDHH